MKIELKSAEVSFGSLRQGQTFEFNGHLFQKIEEMYSDSYCYTAVRCDCGALTSFSHHDQVRPVSGTFRED